MGNTKETTWIEGLSERVGKRPPRGETIAALIRAVGEERVRCGTGDGGGVAMSRRELLARVLWTRALADGDLACARLLIECLDGKLSERSARTDSGVFTADDFSEMERLLGEWRAEKGRDGA